MAGGADETPALHTASEEVEEVAAVEAAPEESSPEEIVIEEAPAVEPVAEKIEIEKAETEESSPATELEEIKETKEEAQIQEVAIESIPKPEPVPLKITQSFQPAHLDQFSRDRFYIQPLIGADRFLLIDPHLLEIVISEKLTCRIGTISSFTGNLQFSQWRSAYGERIPLIEVAGSGVLFLADRRQEIFIISLNNEVIHVEAHHLLVAQHALQVEPYIIEERVGNSFSMLKISGRGTLALTCQTKPLTLNVHESLPVNIPADALIAWSGNLAQDIIQDQELRKVMSSEEEMTFLRFTGIGDVVVEQGGLWGDRRGNK